MRKTISWILFITLLCAAVFQWYAHKAQYRAAGHTIKSGLFPCSSPITYSIGAIDPRFNVSREEFAADIKDASVVWEGALGRDLFEFAASSGDVTVNLVYDSRQAALDKLEAIGLQTGQTHDVYKLLKARYEELSARLDPRQASLAGRLAVYKKREAVYNATVAAYNRRGTATPRQAAGLDAARAALRREFAGIKRTEKEVNADIDLLNAVATTLNQLIVELNLGVAQYNREGAVLGVFEEGVYRVAGGFRTIDVYKYSGRPQLVRLLTHEMGHALGLDHTAAPEALMAPVNRGGSLEVLPDDMAELDRACTSPLKRAFSRGRAGLKGKIKPG